jgi:hypothetical protein
MIVRHSDGIAAFCKPENKVPLGFVEGPNNKIRVIQQGPTGWVMRRRISSAQSADLNAAFNFKGLKNTTQLKKSLIFL